MQLTPEIQATIRLALIEKSEDIGISAELYADPAATQRDIDAALQWLDTLAAGEGWEVVPDGKHEVTNGYRYTIDGQRVLRYDGGYLAGGVMVLPPDWAICRRTPAPQPTTTQEDSNAAQ